MTKVKNVKIKRSTNDICSFARVPVEKFLKLSNRPISARVKSIAQHMFWQKIATTTKNPHLSAKNLWQQLAVLLIGS